MTAFFHKYTMNLNELDNFNLNDAVYFHDKLNPALFNGDKLKNDVRNRLLVIAEDFVEHLGIPHLEIADITLSGSNAAYSYTSHSDVDLHILVDMTKLNDDTVYKELFDAKKTVYNDTHNIFINGYEVELYIQDLNDPVISLGEYSVVKNGWIKLPRKRRANVDQVATRLKYSKLHKLGEYAMKSSDPEKIRNVLRTIKKYRQIGLDRGGEFSPENLAFKILRHKGIIKKLYNRLQSFHDEKLSLPEGASGYIPSPKQKNDPRWKTGLSVDVTPYSIQDNARKLGSKISRAGIPPLLRP